MTQPVTQDGSADPAAGGAGQQAPPGLLLSSGPRGGFAVPRQLAGHGKEATSA